MYNYYHKMDSNVQTDEGLIERLINLNQQSVLDALDTNESIFFIFLINRASKFPFGHSTL